MKKFVVFTLVFFISSFSYISFTKNNPLLDATSSNSQTFDIQQYKGRVVYLDFWASWCVPCRKSFPWMNKLQAQYSKDDFVVVTINLDKKKNLATDFLKEYPANFQVFFDPLGEMAKKYQVKGMPSSILFNREGKPVSAHKGFFGKKIPQYETEIKNLINSSKS